MQSEQSIRESPYGRVLSAGLRRIRENGKPLQPVRGVARLATATVSAAAALGALYAE